MHTKAVQDSEGVFSKPETTSVRCRTKDCPGPVTCKTWESSCGGFEDDRCECTTCRRVWWVEGPDA